MNKSINILDVINQNLDGYKLMFGYSLEIGHGLMGYFPAYFKGAELKQIVYCIDLEVLRKVWALLPPKTSKIRTELYYVNASEEQGYPVVFQYGTANLDAEKCVPDTFLTHEKLETLLRNEESPFCWASGIIGGACSLEFFTQLIGNAIQEAYKARGLVATSQ